MIFLILTSFWFWVVAAMFVLLIFAEANDSSLGTFLTVAVGFVVLHFLSIPILDWIKANVKTLLVYSLAYFPVGTIWAIFKWYLKLLDVKGSILSRENFFKKYALEINKKVFEESDVDKFYSNYLEDSRPKPNKYKERIVLWICNWPISIIFTLFNDFFSKIGNYIYNSIGKYLDNMSKKVFEIK